MSPVRKAPKESADSDFARRTAYLAEVMAVMYPPPCSLTTADVFPDGPLLAEFRAVPDARRPRLLVPVRPRGVAAAAVRRYAQPHSRLARIQRNLAVLALRTGLAPLLLRDRIQVTRPLGSGALDTFDRYLCDALGRDLAMSIHIGPARANRKPVLQLLSGDGETVAFAKVGINALTCELVRLETIALVTLNHLKLRRVQAPRVLHAGQWRDHEVLVQQALPIWGRRAQVPAARLAEAMRELAWSLGVSREPLAGSAYWKALRGRLTTLPEPSSEQVVSLTMAADELVARAGDLELTFGAWHGDWAPWNMAGTPETVLLWDWERFGQDVPVGFDALHHDLQARLEAGADATAALDEMLRCGGRLLAPFGVTDAAQARLTCLLYLVDLATRYLTDRQAEAGAQLGVLGTWLLPVLIQRAAAFERSA